MVNKREKTRSLVYQMKEDIFHQEATLAELEDVESGAEPVSETKVVPLPKYCHHSTGTVYDCPKDILRMARLFEEHSQMLDRRNSSMLLQKTSTPLRSKSRLSANVSPTRSRRNRQNMQPGQADVDHLGSSPAASRSPIQQLFRDKMEGLESGTWAAAALEVKTDATNDDPSETHHETLIAPAVSSSDKLNTVTVTGTFSSTVTSISNGLVKELQAIGNKKRSISKRVGSGNREDKSASSEQMSLTDVVPISDSAVKPAVTVVTDSVVRSDQHPNDLHAETGHADKARAPVRSDRINAENLETAKDKREKSTRRSAHNKCLEPAKTGSQEQSRSSKTDSDTVPRIKTRRRISREQLDAETVNDMQGSVSDEQMPLADVTQINENADIPTAAAVSHITMELSSSQSQRSRVSRSARKTRNNEQSDDSNDTAKPVRRKRAGSSGRGSPGNEKSREKDQASESISDAVLQEELLAAEEHKETPGSGQKVPLQDSLAFNCGNVREPVAQQMSIRTCSSEANDGISLTSLVPSNSEILNSPRFHSDNFGVDPSEDSGDQNQHRTPLQSVTSDTSDLNKSVTPETKCADDAEEASDTPLGNADSTNQLKYVNSPKHRESGNLLDDNVDTFLPKTPVEFLENVKKRSSSVSRSRTKARPSMCEFSNEVEGYDDTEKDSTAKEVGLRKHSLSRRRRRISKGDDDDELVFKSRVMNQSEDGDKCRGIHESITVDNNEDAKSRMSARKNVTELSVSMGSDSSSFLKAADTCVEFTGSTLAEDLHTGVSLSPAANEAGKLLNDDVTGVDSLQTGLQSAVNDGYASSPKILAPNLVKLDVGMSNLHTIRAGFENDITASTLPVGGGWKSGVGLPLSQLAKTTTAGSRQRAAHLMAGCRHRTVGVKKPSLVTAETMSDQPMEMDASVTCDQEPISERLSFTGADLNIYKSAADKCNHPSPAKRRPVFQTESNSSRSVDTLTESSDQFFRTSPPAEITSHLNFSAAEDVGRGEVMKSKREPQYQLGAATNSWWKEYKSNLCERPPMMTHGSAGGGFSGSLHGSRESKTSPTMPPLVVADSHRQLLHSELLRKFSQSQLIVSDSIKRRVQDGLQLISSIRSAPTICSHTRRKLAEYLNQSPHKPSDAVHERLPLRPIDETRIDDKRDQSDGLLRRRVPARPRRRIFSEWDYVSGDELTSPVSDVDSNSDSDYSVDFEDLAVSHASLKSSNSVVRTRDHRLSSVQH